MLAPVRPSLYFQVGFLHTVPEPVCGLGRCTNWDGISHRNSGTDGQRANSVLHGTWPIFERVIQACKQEENTFRARLSVS